MTFKQALIGNMGDPEKENIMYKGHRRSISLTSGEMVSVRKRELHKYTFRKSDSVIMYMGYGTG